MTYDQLQDTYSQRIIQFQIAVRHHVRLMNYLALSRLASLILLVWFIVLGAKNDQPLFYGASVTMLAAFLVLVSRYNKQKDLRNLNTALKELNEREQACQEHRFHTLPEGMEFADPSHPWSNDLDLFGKGSLYQFMNRTSTLKGSALLAGFLTTEPGSPETITERQGINENLRKKIDFRQTFTARGSLIIEKDDDIQGILKWLSAPAYIVKYRWLFFLALGVSITALVIIAAGIINPAAFNFLLPLLFFNFTVLSPFLARTNRYQQTISKKHELLEGYAQLLKIIAASGFEHPVLQENCKKAREGMKEVERLSRLLNFFDQRLNMLLGSIFNGLFLYDFIMMHLLESWKKRNSGKIMDWIEIMGWTDAMITLSGFAYNHPDFVLPEIKAENKSLEFEEMGHPLIPPGKRVNNQLTIRDEKIVIITGANMAGKSTFLRSLGINTILAYAGCPVCASRFSDRFHGALFKHAYGRLPGRRRVLLSG